jgi:protein-tyrosine phosphatase
MEEEKTKREKLERVADEGFHSFWQEIAKHYPEVTTGDFPPDAHFTFAAACEDALQTWLDWNHPDHAENE